MKNHLSCKILTNHMKRYDQNHRISIIRRWARNSCWWFIMIQVYSIVNIWITEIGSIIRKTHRHPVGSLETSMPFIQIGSYLSDKQQQISTNHVASIFNQQITPNIFFKFIHYMMGVLRASAYVYPRSGEIGTFTRTSIVF